MSLALAVLALLAPRARADVPSLPGFSLEWSDDFTGAAGSLPDSSRWILTTGTSYPGGAPQFGTWEIETYTDSPENVQTDGQGNRKCGRPARVLPPPPPPPGGAPGGGGGGGGQDAHA